MKIETISTHDADIIRLLDEGQFVDLKSVRILPADLTKTISAFANSDGGEIYIGIEDKTREWIGFSNEEAANGHIQTFEEFFPLGQDFQYSFLKCEGYSGLALHVQVEKTRSVAMASNKTPYLRRAAQNLPQNTPDKLKRLELSKGISSFESETVNVSKDVILESEVSANFIKAVVPTTTMEPFFRKQRLIVGDMPIVAGILIFSDLPQALLPKHCGVKIYRYKSRDIQGHRDMLAEDPITVEGDLYTQIKISVRTTKTITEAIPFLWEGGLGKISYPHETLHEILTNAVLHRDYSIKDDIHVRIFDDRIEVQSPGKLPANITPANILDERFARNGHIVRMLNKFPNPPNKDVGEGLNTAFIKMKELGLKDPVVQELDNAVLVLIKHEPLASPSAIIMDFLETHDSIKNGKAREITHTNTDFKMKSVFNKMEKAGLIEKVPGTNTSSTAWRKVGPKKGT